MSKVGCERTSNCKIRISSKDAFSKNNCAKSDSNVKINKKAKNSASLKVMKPTNKLPIRAKSEPYNNKDVSFKKQKVKADSHDKRIIKEKPLQNKADGNSLNVRIDQNHIDENKKRERSSPKVKTTKSHDRKKNYEVVADKVTDKIKNLKKDGLEKEKLFVTKERELKSRESSNKKNPKIINKSDKPELESNLCKPKPLPKNSTNDMSSKVKVPSNIIKKPKHPQNELFNVSDIEQDVEDRMCITPHNGKRNRVDEYPYLKSSKEKESCNTFKIIDRVNFKNDELKHKREKKSLSNKRSNKIKRPRDKECDCRFQENTDKLPNNDISNNLQEKEKKSQNKVNTNRENKIIFNSRKNSHEYDVEDIDNIQKAVKNPAKKRFSKINDIKDNFVNKQENNLENRMQENADMFLIHIKPKIREMAYNFIIQLEKDKIQESGTKPKEVDKDAYRVKNHNKIMKDDIQSQQQKQKIVKIKDKAHRFEAHTDRKDEKRAFKSLKS